MKAHKVISWVTALLVFLLACAEFVLSFSSLKELAADNGIHPSLAFVFPLIIDGAMIVFSLAVMRNELYGEPTWVGWLLIGAFTMASTIFNIVHSTGDLLAAFIAAVAPVALFHS